MKPALLITLVVGLLGGDFNRIATVNQYKKEGENAYRASDYPGAIKAFKLLVDSLGVDDESVTLNLANAYFETSDTTNAAYYYSRLAESPMTEIKSSALNQLGIIDQQKNNLEGALANFKSALKADATNENARYNYELVKKLLEQQQEQEQQQDQNQNQDQENKDQQQKDQEQQQKEQEQQKEQQQQDQEKQEQEKQQNQDSEKKEEGNPEQEQETKEEGEEMDQQPPKSRQEKLEELNLTEEKARMILEAMKNNEMQYLQQMQRKPTKKQDSDKPDW